MAILSIDIQESKSLRHKKEEEKEMIDRFTEHC